MNVVKFLPNSVPMVFAKVVDLDFSGICRAADTLGNVEANRKLMRGDDVVWIDDKTAGEGDTDLPKPLPHLVPHWLHGRA